MKNPKLAPLAAAIAVTVGLVVGGATATQAATVTCTATTVRDTESSFVSNHRGECYRVQAQGRRYFGNGVYTTVTASASTYTSKVTRSPGISLDQHKVRAQPVNDPAVTWSGWYSQAAGTESFKVFTAYT